MTGWRIGWAHGPQHVIQQMLKLQQFTFVCSPHPVQYAGLVAWDCDVSQRVAEYKSKRDFMVSQLKDDFEIHVAGGAFYLFLKAPYGTGAEFVAEAIRNNLLIIPGNVFSPADTHFRVSYAAEQRTLERGCEVLLKLARQASK
jgi:aspartate aminotransferase